jgi:hypothetical protein
VRAVLHVTYILAGAAAALVTVVYITDTKRDLRRAVAQAEERLRQMQERIGHDVPRPDLGRP